MVGFKIYSSPREEVHLRISSDILEEIDKQASIAKCFRNEYICDVLASISGKREVISNNLANALKELQVLRSQVKKSDFEISSGVLEAFNVKKRDFLYVVEHRSSNNSFSFIDGWVNSIFSVYETLQANKGLPVLNPKRIKSEIKSLLLKEVKI